MLSTGPYRPRCSQSRSDWVARQRTLNGPGMPKFPCLLGPAILVSEAGRERINFVAESADCVALGGVTHNLYNGYARPLFDN